MGNGTQITNPILLIDDGRTLTIDYANNHVGVGQTTPAYPLDVLSIEDEIALYIRQNSIVADMYALDVLSYTAGARIRQSLSLGGNSNYFEPNYPTLKVTRASSSRGASILLGNANGGFYQYGTSSAYCIFNPDGTTNVLTIDATNNLVDVKVGLKLPTDTPSSASDTGVTGQICWDSSYMYVCVATNTWKRSAIGTW